MALMRSDNGDADNYPQHTPLSSAGLVYYLPGRELLAEIMGTDREDPLVEIIFTKVYVDIVEALDADANDYSCLSSLSFKNVDLNGV